MKPTLVIVGRPNVGKSTLFNRLTKSRDALVADIPGLTRDRHYGHGRQGDKAYLVVDTGGFEPSAMITENSTSEVPADGAGQNYFRALAQDWPVAAARRE